MLLYIPMPYGDGIPRTNCYSLTDFHEFDYCPFRFFVFHHLEKKYELAEGSENLALGSLLDQAIKIFHSSKAYGQSPEYIANLIIAAFNFIKERAAKQPSPTFYSSITPFLTDKLCNRATEIFKNYYLTLNREIKQSLGEVGFCEWIIDSPDGNLSKTSGQRFKLWGGPDALELGEDGIPEIVDYKYRENTEKGKEGLDMDLMPKIYTLLVANKLLDWGYKKARFVVRFWLDPKEDNFYEEFDLEKVKEFEKIFEQKIAKILSTREISYCEKSFCKACTSPKRPEFLRELEKKNLILTLNF